MCSRSRFFDLGCQCLETHFKILFGENPIFFLQLCVQNSPQEARNMLLQNPQLAYALLQAQVVMRIVDPEIALVREAASGMKRFTLSVILL